MVLAETLGRALVDQDSWERHARERDLRCDRLELDPLVLEKGLKALDQGAVPLDTHEEVVELSRGEPLLVDVPADDSIVHRIACEDTDVFLRERSDDLVFRSEQR